MIALHRVVLAWENGCRLEIESVAGEEGEVVALPFPLSEATRETKPTLAFTPALCWREESERLFESLQLREETEYIVSATVPLPLDEAKRKFKEVENPAWPFVNARLRNSFRANPPRLWNSVATDEIGGGAGTATRVDGRLNFRSYAGITDLSLLNDDAPIRAEVACSKLSYFEDLVALLEDVAAYVTELLFQIDSATGIPLTDDDTVPSSAATLFHLRRLMAPQELPSAMASIFQSPISRLETLESAVPTALTRNVDPANLVAKINQNPFQQGGPLQSVFNGYTPRSLPETRKHDSVDVAENRFVKDVVRQIEAACEHLVEQLSKENPRQNQASLREATGWLSSCREWLDEPLWREVGNLTYFPSNSQALQKRSGYKEVLGAWTALQLGLQLPWPQGESFADGTQGDIRPIYQLYEFWCFFALREIMRDLCGAEDAPGAAPDEFLRVDLGKLEINLKSKQTSYMKFNYISENQTLKIRLWYHKEFRRKTGFSEWNGSYSGQFNPDYSISIETASNVTHWLHFDAKYKLSFSKWQAEVSGDEEIIRTEEPHGLNENNSGANVINPVDLDDGEIGDFYRDDLFKMHSYRDAILGSRGAYVLFPGTSEEKQVFVRHHSPEYRAEFNIPSAGAFPLRPQGSQNQSDNLKMFIGEVLSSLAKAQDYCEEVGVVKNQGTSDEHSASSQIQDPEPMA